MKKAILWTVGAGLIATVATVAIFMSERHYGPPFIEGNQAVTAERIQQKLESEGWSNIQIVRNGRYFEAIASKDGENNKFVVDRLTGRLRAPDDDDDD